MEQRQLGRSGFKVPVLSLGTGTFGGKGDFFAAWGATDVAQARSLIDMCLEAGLNMFDSADIYSSGAAESILGEALQGRQRDSLIVSTKATFRFGEGANEVGSSRQHLLRLRRRGAEAPAHRPYRCLPAARLRCAGAGRRDSGHARQPGAGRQAALHRRLQLLGLAPDEVAGRRRAPGPDTLWPTGPIARWSGAAMNGS